MAENILVSDEMETSLSSDEVGTYNMVMSGCLSFPCTI